MIRAIKWWGESGTGETRGLPGIALIGLPVLLVMLVLSGCGGDQKGGKMVYTSQEEGIQNIYLVDPGKNPLNLTDSPSKDSSPRLSPDGKMVAFVSERNGKRDVFIIDVKGQGLVQISLNFVELGIDLFDCLCRFTLVPPSLNLVTSHECGEHGNGNDECD